MVSLVHFVRKLNKDFRRFCKQYHKSARDTSNDLTHLMDETYAMTCEILELMKAMSTMKKDMAHMMDEIADLNMHMAHLTSERAAISERVKSPEEFQKTVLENSNLPK